MASTVLLALVPTKEILPNTVKISRVLATDVGNVELVGSGPPNVAHQPQISNDRLKMGQFRTQTGSKRVQKSLK